MADIKLSIDDLPPATTVYNADVFAIDQMGGDGYTKKLTYNRLKTTLSDNFVLKAGDTMTGPLILDTSTPTISLQAASKGYVDALVLGKVSKAGDVMTGPLILNTSTPISSLQAASKGYVDALVLGKVSKAGDTMTGPLTLNSNSPTEPLHAASRGYVQNNFLPISGIGTGEQNTGMTGFLTLCAHPISAFHAATKFYVDSRSGNDSRALAKAWVNFVVVAGAPTIKSAFNVSSIGDVSTGIYGVSFITNFANTDYACIGTGNGIIDVAYAAALGVYAKAVNYVQLTTSSPNVPYPVYPGFPFDTPEASVVFYSN